MRNFGDENNVVGETGMIFHYALTYKRYGNEPKITRKIGL